MEEPIEDATFPFVGRFLLARGSHRVGSPHPPAELVVRARRPSGTRRPGPLPGRRPCGPNVPMKTWRRTRACFELRTYTVREGSGNIDVPCTRVFPATAQPTAPSSGKNNEHDQSRRLLWQPVAKPDQLILHSLAYKDRRRRRDASWMAFQTDPELDESGGPEMGGQTSRLDNVFMSAKRTTDRSNRFQSSRFQVQGSGFLVPGSWFLVPGSERGTLRTEP